MEQMLDGPVLVEDLPALNEHDGIMYISRNGTCRAAMRMEVFEAYMFAGMEAVTAWRGRPRPSGKVLRFKKD